MASRLHTLIAVGALAIGLASSLTRAGYGQYLYLGELVSAVLMYSGFLLAAGPRSEPVPAEKQASTAAAG